MKSWHITLGSVLALCLLVLPVAVACAKPAPPAPAPAAAQKPAPAAAEKWPPNISIGTASTGSGFYIQATGLAVMMEKYLKITTVPEPIGASNAVISALAAKKIEFVQTHGVVCNDAFLATAFWPKDVAPVETRLVAGGPGGVFICCVDGGSNIVNFEDMRGKKVMYICTTDKYMAEVFEYMLKAYGMTPDDVKAMKWTAVKEMIDAIDSGAADVLWRGHSATGLTPEFMERDSRKPLRWVQAAKDKLERAEALSGGRVMVTTYPGGLYKLHPKEQPVLGYMTAFAARADMPESLVYSILKMIWDEHLDEFHAIYSVNKLFTIENTIKASVLIPFHPGAVKYLKEKGVWNSELETKQKKLLDSFGSSRK